METVTSKTFQLRIPAIDNFTYNSNSSRMRLVIKKQSPLFTVSVNCKLRDDAYITNSPTVMSIFMWLRDNATFQQITETYPLGIHVPVENTKTSEGDMELKIYWKEGHQILQFVGDQTVGQIFPCTIIKHKNIDKTQPCPGTGPLPSLSNRSENTIQRLLRFAKM